MLRPFVTSAVLILLTAASAPGQDRDTKVRNDLRDVEAVGTWIYNDLPRGLAEAERTGRPLLVVFRCIP